MAKKRIGYYRDILTHPGEILKEILDDRNITQKELSTKIGYSEQQISRVITGKNNISPDFAKLLEYALGIEIAFWLNLQTKYDIELLECDELDSVTDEELSISKTISKITKEFVSLGLIPDNVKKKELVISLRKVFEIANLTLIPKMMPIGCYRAAETVKTDIYILFAWHKLCDIIASRNAVDIPLDTDLLKSSLSVIKSLMFEEPSVMVSELHLMFAKCGISFNLVPHFTGAPVQGFIKIENNGSANLSMTIRGAWAGIFWFTLLHEIGHILNGDIDGQFTDYVKEDSHREREADKFATNTLIDPDLYERFISNRDFSEASVVNFASINKVPTFIVVERLQRERCIPYNSLLKYKLTYKWAT